MKKEKNVRNLTIDVAKGIGIFLVVLAHTVKNEFVHNLIYMFHMPLFFILAGMTIKYSLKNDTKDFFKKKVKRIIIPYLFFCLVSIVYWGLIERRVRGQADISILGNFINIFLFRIDGNLYAYNIALWFLPCLFISELVAYFIIKKVTNKKILFGTSLILFTIGMVVVYFKIALIFAIETALVSQFFIIIGYFFEEFLQKEIKKYWNVILVLISVCFAAISMIFHNEVGMLGHNYGNVILFLMGAIGGSYLTYSLAELLKDVKALQFIGVNSLVILGFHEPLKRAIIKVSSIIIKLSDSFIRGNILLSIAMSIIILIIMVPVIIVFNKYFPILVGKKKEC